MRGSNEESLIDIPSRTSENGFSTASRENNRIQSTTTDRPSFLPPKETVVGNNMSLLMSKSFVRLVFRPLTKYFQLLAFYI